VGRKGWGGKAFNGQLRPEKHVAHEVTKRPNKLLRMTREPSDGRERQDQGEIRNTITEEEKKKKKRGRRVLQFRGEPVVKVERESLFNARHLSKTEKPDFFLQ